MFPFKKLALCLLFSFAAKAQLTSNPFCLANFSFTGTGVTSNFSNIDKQCQFWTVSYTSNGFSAISLAFESAADASGSASTFTNFSGSLLSGSNPNTNLGTQTATFSGNVAWLRMNLATATGTGTITGSIFGYLQNPSGTGVPNNGSSVSFDTSGNGTGVNNVTSTGSYTGISFIGSGSNGAAILTEGTCPTAAAGKDIICADSTANGWQIKENGGVARSILGITIPVASATTLSPADSTTYFSGCLYAANPTVTSAVRQCMIPKTGLIKRIYLIFQDQGTVGTSETSTISFRYDDTTDTTISAVVTNDAAITKFNNTALGISVQAGHFFELKWVTPAWATNPTNVGVSGIIYIE